MPRTLHAEKPTPEVDWSAGTVRLLTSSRPWPGAGRPRRAGVSSFGISGTNAHVIIEQAPPAPDPAAPDPADSPAPESGPESGPPAPWLLSAKTPQALADHARRLAAWHQHHPEIHPDAAARHLATARAQFTHRAAITPAAPHELPRALRALADGRPDPVLLTATAAGGVPRPVLLFPGQGAQWPGMARALLTQDETFAAAVADCAAALDPITGWSLHDALTTTDDAFTQRVDVIQPALFAVMVSLAAVWRARGLRPAAVAGHSQGEIAAACVAGVLTLPDAARVVAVRSRLLTRLAGTGSALSVGLSADEARRRITRWPDLSLAADNGPAAVVVSGPARALDDLAASCAGDGVRTRRVEVDFAAHSAAVESLREPLLTGLTDIRPRPAVTPVYSTLTGGPADGTTMNPDYWYRNLRYTVRYRETIAALSADGHTHYVEVSTHPALAIGTQQTLGTLDDPAPVLPTLRRGHGTAAQLRTAAAAAHAHGLTLDWPAARPPAAPAGLPAYPFQHTRYWLDPAPADQPKPQPHDSRRYRITWQPVPVPPGGRLPGSWLVLAPAGDRARWADDALAARGAAVTRLELTGEDADRGRLGTRLKEALGNTAGGVTGVLSLLAAAQRPHPGLPGLPEGLALNISAIQALGDVGIDGPLWMVTEQAVAVTAAERVAHPVQAHTWGLGRVAALEHPLRWGGLIDLPADPDAGTAALLAGVLAAVGDEDQWAIRAGGGHVARLSRYRRRADGPGREWHPADTVLITGASGSLGPHIARWAAGRGARRIVLASRQGPASPSTARLLGELSALGVTASAQSCDFGSRDDVAALTGRLAAAGHTVRTVFHAAAHLSLGVLAETTLTEVAEVVRAKADGAVYLAELLDPEALRDLVLFSSIAGVWGSGEHAAYAAANAFLDAFAQQRRADGLPATSVAWGIWGEQATVDRVDAARVVRRGLPFIPPEQAFSALEQVLGDNETALAVADVDWASFLPVFTSMRPSPLISEVPEVRAAAGQVAAAPGRGPRDDLRQRLATLSATERGDAVLALVRAQAAAVLGHASADRIAPERAFRELGFDSVMAVDLRNRLSGVTGLPLPPTLVFDHANAASLAGHLGHELLGDRPATTDSVIADLDRLEGSIVGLASDESARLRLTGRLEAVLRRLAELRVPAGGADAGLDVENASTEEILHFLDQQYGETEP